MCLRRPRIPGLGKHFLHLAQLNAPESQVQFKRPDMGTSQAWLSVCASLGEKEARPDTSVLTCCWPGDCSDSSRGRTFHPIGLPERDTSCSLFLGIPVLVSLTGPSWVFKCWSGPDLSVDRFLLELDRHTIECCLRFPSFQPASGVHSRDDRHATAKPVAVLLQRAISCSPMRPHQAPRQSASSGKIDPRLGFLGLRGPMGPVLEGETPAVHSAHHPSQDHLIKCRQPDSASAHLMYPLRFQKAG